jgi:site-specific DNA-methyltransferase (adenine-specific)
MTEVFNEDCMAVMSRYPDKWFELAVVDPPYGIDIAKWDTKEHKPKKAYFDELFRVSQNQIIWGGNYFELPHSEAWLCWDKTYKYKHALNIGEFELAWSSFDHKSIFIRFTYCGNFYGWEKPKAHYDKKENIHVTQKPIDIYDWIFARYAKPNDKILDTHLGSGSSRIAAHRAGLDFTGCEIDKDYFDAQEKRFKNYISQLRLF